MCKEIYMRKDVLCIVKTLFAAFVVKILFCSKF
ncbi:MAG: hypothetical protein JWN76_2168 [Chitinophagaceae bacterium]|nr:hypothetical protein [Chitinophagaceae bacterium]